MEPDDLNLPDRDYAIPFGAYGDQKVAAEYCGLRTPSYPIRGEWQHGWLPPEGNLHPEYVVGSDGRSHAQRERRPFFVARQDQADYLRSHGYTQATAIGLPIIYLQPSAVRRRSGSLLVMPMHSTSESKEDWSGSEYAQYVKTLIPRFDSLSVCIHRSCWNKSHWVEAFRKIGVALIEGAEERDQNSYQRMAALFCRFDFITTNFFGSHVVYAAFFGCRVSVAGPQPQWNESMTVEQTLYKNVPELVEITRKIVAERLRERDYPMFVCHPWDAGPHRDWAAWQIGEQHKRSPAELRRLFRWRFRDRASRLIVPDFCRRFRDRASYRLRRVKEQYGRARLLTRSIGWFAPVALCQLHVACRQTSGVTRIRIGNGRSLILRNGSSDIDVFRQHFIRRELMDIAYPSSVFTVLDLGANIGVSVAIFRRLFPAAQIVAVELDATNADLCRNNHREDSLVTVISGAIWKESGQVGVRDVGDHEWAYQVEPGPRNGAPVVPAMTFAEILARNSLERIDVMKMDIEGAEADVLEASWEPIFRSTRLAIIEIHGWIGDSKMRAEAVIELAREHYALEVSHAGEFLVLRNRNLDQP